MNKEFIDTNIFIYLLDEEESFKYEKSSELYARSGLCASTQVLAEVVNVCMKKLKKSKVESMQLIDKLRNDLEILPTISSDFDLTHSLILKYDFQYFDALIVATALNHGCSTLYTEDLQHNQVIENKLTIVNPFI